MKYRRNISLFIIGIIFISIILNGCLPKPQAKPEIKPKTKIGLSMAETNSERNKFIKKNVEEAAKNGKIRLVITDAHKDSLQQKTNIEKMISEKVKAVILQPVDTAIVKDYISMLQEKNIKVILIDALPVDVSVDAFIAPDFVRAGELQAQYILNKGEEQRILILKGDKTNNIAEKILQGNLNILKNNSLVKNIVIQEVPQWDQREAYNLMLKNMEQESFTSIIAHYEEIAAGAIKFLKEQNLNDKVAFTTIAINKDLLQEINNNEKMAAVDTLPNLVSQFSLKTALNLIDTNSWEYDLQIKNGLASVPAKIIPVRLINKTNFYLLKERFGEIKSEEKEEAEVKSNEKESNKEDTKSSSIKQSKLKIKTKDGKEFEVTIPGEIQGVEMQPKEE